MPPAKSSDKKLAPSEKKYASLYVDAEDEHSPPPPNGIPIGTSAKSKSKGKSRKGTKRKHAPQKPEADSDDEPALPKGPVVDFFEGGGDISEPSTPLGKVSKSCSRTRIRRRSGPLPEYGPQGNHIAPDDGSTSDSDVPQDGRGDPNLSTISVPLPDNLVEPQLQGHETGFHVITSGTTVGISLFIGIGKSYLNCANPSMVTFSTWALAKAYYSECFANDSVHIREPQGEQTPIHSPVRKRQKLRNTPSKKPPLSAVLAQPHFAPIMSPKTPPGIPLVSSDEYSPLVFPESPPAKAAHHVVQETASDIITELAKSINSRYLSARAQATTQISIDSAPQPPVMALTPSPQIVRAHAITSFDEDVTASPAVTNFRGHNRPRVIVADSSDEDAPAPPATTLFKGNNRPHVIVADSSDEGAPAPPATTTTFLRNNRPHVIVIDSSDEEVTAPPVATTFNGNSRPHVIVIDSSDEDATSPPAAPTLKGPNCPHTGTAGPSDVHSTAAALAIAPGSDGEEFLLFDSETERQLDELLGEQRAGRRKRSYRH